MIHELCAPVSNMGDWHYTTQLRSDDNTSPLWSGAAPVDLVIYLVFTDARNEQVLKADGYATMATDSYLTIDMPASAVNDLKEGRYAVHVRYTTNGATMSYLLGYLPVYEGF